MTQYETTEGTEPVAHGVHEPRTIKRLDDETDLHMMTEIGDGVFVQWSSCRKCTARVYDCKCSGGPTGPEYMDRWRANRFAKDLNTRPEPSYELIPALTTWLEERGYEVTKSVKKQLEEAKPVNTADLAIEDLTDEDAEAFDAAMREGEPVELDVQIDRGLDAAKKAVKGQHRARPEDFEEDF